MISFMPVFSRQEITVRYVSLIAGVGLASAYPSKPESVKQQLEFQ
jgi:hypothetical protein